MGIEFQSSALMKRFKQMEALAPQLAEKLVNDVSQSGLTESTALAAHRSGELRGSILLSPIKKEDGEITGGYYTNIEHATYVEYGTGQRGASGSTKNGLEKNPKVLDYREDWAGMSAQPFMYPTARKLEEEVIPPLLEKMGKSILNGGER